MIQKIKGYIFIAISAAMLILSLAIPVAVSAATSGDCNSNIQNNIASGASTASGSTVNCSDTGVGGNSLAQIASQIVNIFSIVVGAIAVIMIIYGGFRYITSGGESGRVGNAKNTLIYAIIGLIIVALAQLIVHFVLNQSNSVNSSATGSILVRPWSL